MNIELMGLIIVLLMSLPVIGMLWVLFIGITVSVVSDIKRKAHEANARKELDK
jgi:hypothetical protein